MDKIFILLFLASFSFAVPACPHYTYMDYVTAEYYHPPTMPEDTLLQYCSWRLSEVCIVSNFLNTTEDKKFFIAESIANDSFDKIMEWNQNINFGKYPPNSSKSSKNIKDAWVSIAYLNPSVYDNGTYLITNSSQPLIKHAFTFVVDTRILPGDCDDNFRICGYDYSIGLLNTSSSLTATMNVRSQYLVDRYHLVTHCDLTGCWVTCDYYRTDSFTDSLTVSDSKKINATKFNPTSNYSLVAYYNGLFEILINANDSNLLFNVGNSSFYKTNYLYKIRNESGPYNILVKEVIPTNKISTYGLSILEKNDSLFKILAPYSENCSLKISDHFYSKIISGCTIPNTTDTFTKPETNIAQPEFFNSLLDIALLGIAGYVVYLIVKKVAPNV